MNISTTVSQDNTELTISILGTFDFSCVQDFRASYSGDDRYKKYTVDMTEVDHIDSSALGMLLNMKKTVGEFTAIRIVNCKPSIKKIFEISRFDKKFDFS
ncbi:STAS domain-containing protein [Alkalimarinus alittae]|uniref:STAS domain-containing protein n=1 Tax=Alkalimarinus alittae TaxID=2961619 RepID=A0ABY6MXZ1_9ALTE|nr:STAS domain-containing protein [Alkalimarinus alittae]UZE94707.1 STAS domain-containing protein [Alkalimarinus alittae]